MTWSEVQAVLKGVPYLPAFDAGKDDEGEDEDDDNELDDVDDVPCKRCDGYVTLMMKLFMLSCELSRRRPNKREKLCRKRRRPWTR